LQVGQQRRNPVRDPRGLRTRHSDRSRRRAVEDRLPVDRAQLLSTRADRWGARGNLVGRRRQEAVHRTGADDRRGAHVRGDARGRPGAGAGFLTERVDMTEVIAGKTAGAVKGMLDIDALRGEVEAGTIDTVLTAFTDMQGRLFGKRVEGEFFLEESLSHGIEGCNYLLALDMEMDPIPGSG